MGNLILEVNIVWVILYRSLIYGVIAVLFGIIWSWRAASSSRERWLGTAIAITGNGLTAAQVAFYIHILWQSI